ncbi:VPLPA-CTERM sorting domain-containing protein [uncultured Jannaschia sp.]|uniref:VPLPA-CTERM sorting domain-containing protein n=1 Tax=uncultured Jannaschia sp. TaxID=293347 RepID=UPI0026169C73|nr:VPLPA-CTERM sorting domain-containing protein [uncultured Jannaschia sp.]
MVNEVLDRFVFVFVFGNGLMKLSPVLYLFAGASFAVAASVANAAVVRIEESSFLSGAGLITFSEFGLDTVNPTYAPADYGGDSASPTVGTGGYFVGQSLSADAATDCPGAAATACIVGTPSGPLALDGDAPTTFIAEDGATPTSPTLSGRPLFNGPIALLFSEDQYGVGFTAGFFDAAMSTGITAFGRDGTLLGTVLNEGRGIEFLGLVSEDADIAGVFLDLVGSEPAGFVIDNLRFGNRGDVDPGPSPVPLPAGFPLMLAGLAAIGVAGRKRH